MNFDILSFIFGKLNCGSNFNDVVSYLMGKAVGVVTEVVQDIYNELRSSLVHTSIDIGGIVYPRVDNTRLGLETIKGRTVAFNQLAWGPTTQTVNEVTFTNNGDGSITVNGTATTQTRVTVCYPTIEVGHKIFMRGCPTDGRTATYCLVDNYQSANQYDFGGGKIYNVTGARISVYIQIANGYTANNLVFIPQVFDLTAMYGTTLADSIYAMEQATHGAGVAYVRQRLPLDYYAYNAGELKAPVVSGWSVTDTDEQTTTLSIPSTTLNGVGTAQDYIEAVEVGENDYSLIKHTLMGEVDLGTLSWKYANGWWQTTISGIKYVGTNTEVGKAIAQNFTLRTASGMTTAVAGELAIDTSNVKAVTGSNSVTPTGYLVYELATPTETTIAEHLTLAEVSAIAQNGGIIGIVNSNGDIVQPDLTVTTVINKSAITN